MTAIEPITTVVPDRLSHQQLRGAVCPSVCASVCIDTRSAGDGRDSFAQDLHEGFRHVVATTTASWQRVVQGDTGTPPALAIKAWMRASSFSGELIDSPLAGCGRTADHHHH